MDLELRNKKWAHTYVNLVETILEHGQDRDSRDGPTKDLGPTHFHLAQIPDYVRLDVRKGLVAFAEAEQLCYLAGLDAGNLTPWAPSYTRYGIDKGDGTFTFPGSYGPRLVHELPKVVRILEKSSNSRQAVVHIHDRHDTTRAALGGEIATDIPCTCLLNFFQRDNALWVHSVMRSTDVWTGIYHDLPAFAFLASRVAEALRWNLGGIVFTTTSLHMYDRHFEKGSQLVSAWKTDQTAPERMVLGHSDLTTKKWLDPNRYGGATPAQRMEGMIDQARVEFLARQLEKIAAKEAAGAGN